MQAGMSHLDMGITLRLLRAGSCTGGRSRRCLCSGFQLLRSRAGGLTPALKPCNLHLHAACISWHGTMTIGRLPGACQASLSHECSPSFPSTCAST